MSLSCRKHSLIYQSRSITTVPEPLSADLMTMSLRLLTNLQACRSNRSWFEFKEVVPYSVKKSVKCRVPVWGRGPTAFGTEWVKISVSRIVMKVLEETHPSTKFMKISSNLSPVSTNPWTTTLLMTYKNAYLNTPNA